jgi:hypothetical protein
MLMLKCIKIRVCLVYVTVLLGIMSSSLVFLVVVPLRSMGIR